MNPFLTWALPFLNLLGLDCACHFTLPFIYDFLLMRSEKIPGRNLGAMRVTSLRSSEPINIKPDVAWEQTLFSDHPDGGFVMMADASGHFLTTIPHSIR